jgi:hypothetical protein
MTLLTAWIHYDYVAYIMDTSQYDVCSMDSLNLRCLHYRPIKPTLFIVYTHQHYGVYRRELLNLRCLNGGFIKRTLLTVWIHQPYIVYIMDPTFYLVNSMEPSNTVYIIGLVNLRCMQYVPIQPFLQPDKHTPDT